MRLSIICAALAAACVAAPPAHAAPTTPARIVFTGDGSIFTMDPDGSDRVQLTHGSPVYQGHVYDYGPRWSPSGRLIAFDRNRSDHPLGLGNYRSEVWVMRPDGTHARQLVPRDANLIGFMPNGDVLVDRTTRRRRYVVVDPKTGAKRRARELERFAYELVISPDGKHVAGYGVDGAGLSVARLDGTHGHLIDPKGSEPAWSPDGRRLAWASEADRNGLWCEFEGPCDVRAEIYVADADGGHRRRITREKGNDRHPTWSPDGRRIAFQSDLNWPYFYTTEIYSIEPDGDCLTWLTNGAVQSDSPDWSPTGEGTAPAGCGAAGRRPVMDLDLTPLAQRHYPLYWFGPVMPGRRLLSNIDVRSRFVGFRYGDCGYFTPSRCGRGGYLYDYRTCTAAAELLDVEGKPRDLQIRRGGALVLFPAPYPYRSASVYTGVTAIELADTTYLRRLRRYPSSGPTGPLPAAQLPEWLWDDLERTEESYGRTHSEEATAKELGLTPRQVRHRLALAKRLRELGVDGRVECEPGDAPGE